MEEIINIAKILFILVLLVLPIVFYKYSSQLKRYNLVCYIISAFTLSGLFTLFFAWWCDYSDLKLLEYYGCNIDGLNETEFYQNVAKENIYKAKELQTSIIGIGWPVKAIILYPFYVIYIVVYLIIKKFL